MPAGRQQPRSILISAGESSGDLYASALAEALRRTWPDTRFFGCAGPRMEHAGVRQVVNMHSLAVVGLVEVIGHLPRIYGEFRKLLRAASEEKPDFAILTDSPDFHLRLAGRLAASGVPVLYLIAPQAWAWRSGRVRQMRKTLARLFCIFPFEEEFFRSRGVPATYIGHPLSRMVKPRYLRDDFFQKHRIPAGRRLIALCPGSRRGEIHRHLPALLDAVDRLYHEQATTFVLAAPLGFTPSSGDAFFRERISRSPIQVIEGETWDVLAHADLTLAASGTVTIEAALLGAPMVTFYKVTPLSWWLGRFLVNVPFYSMVNLVAERRLAPELMQNEMTGENLADEARRLLSDPAALAEMKLGLAEVAARLAAAQDPIERAAGLVRAFFDERVPQ